MNKYYVPGGGITAFDLDFDLAPMLTGNDMSFKSVENKIAKKEGVSKKTAAKELAASTRRASPAAKRKNPNLKKVKG